MTRPVITALPAAPVRGEDAATFATKANTFVAALPAYGTESNALGAFVENAADDANDSAVAAAASASAAAAFAGADEWVSGQSYAEGDAVYSPINSLSYRANTATSGTTDPSLSADWNPLFSFDVADAVGVLPVDNGGTGLSALGTAGQALVVNSGATALEFASVESVVQYPQNSQSADYTLVLSDAGKQIFHPAADTSQRTFTIPANSSVAFPIGTVVLFTVENGGRAVDVTITSDTLISGTGTTGLLRVLSNNTLMCIKVAATKWMANYFFQAAENVQSIAVVHNTFPFVSAYPWSSSGFGTKYADPGTFLPNTSNGAAFSAAGDAIAVAHFTTPFVSAYPWSVLGFGTKYTNPGTLPASTGRGVAFSPDGDAIAVAHNNSPFVAAYPWSFTGFGTKFTDPAGPPTGNALGVTFSPAGDAIAVAHDGSPFVSAYPWSGSGFGTKYTNPATLPAGPCFDVAFSPAGDAIAVGHQFGSGIAAYPWSGSGFGTRFADPATLPTGDSNGVTFSPAGDAIAVAHNNSPFVSAYPWSGSGFGTKYANPATLPTGTGNGVAFSPAGDAIAIAHATTPFVSAYSWSGSGFGTKYANPVTLPTGTGVGVAFAFNS